MHQPHQMPRPSHIPFTMEHMHRDVESLQQAYQRVGSPRWAGEFDPGQEQTSRMEAAFQNQKTGGFDTGEFQRYSQMQPNGVEQTTSNFQSSTGQINGYQRPMRMGYGGMGMGMGSMGMGIGMMNRHSALQPLEAHGKGKGRMVELDDKDWQAHFDRLTEEQQQTGDLDEEAEKAVQAELDEMDRSVSPNLLSDSDPFGDFEDIWQGIQAESARNMLGEDTNWHAGDYAEWDRFDDRGVAEHLRNPEMGNYLFEEDNIFRQLGDPYREGVRIMDEGGNLSLAALAFEAAVQKDPLYVDAWTRLGAAQAQNEKESPAIRALEQAIKLDPANLDALMGLAVSYTNEGYDSTAYRTLERWLSTKYPSITSGTGGNGLGGPSDDPFTADLGFTDRHILHGRVTDLFIRAAQLSPDPSTMDPDVQVGLGVLFYGAEEFDKAVDCFSAALDSSEAGSTNAVTEMGNQRPLLWNRLGATLANSGRSEEAIQAYEKALELNPNFVRARYNLGVSCINIGCYAEAAQHLLGALSMHAVVEKEGRDKAREIVNGGVAGRANEKELERMLRQNQSTNLYDTLRRVFGQMGRTDLADKVVAGVDVDLFRADFEF